jgi:hypothetical protein
MACNGYPLTNIGDELSDGNLICLLHTAFPNATVPACPNDSRANPAIIKSRASIHPPHASHRKSVRAHERAGHRCARRAPFRAVSLHRVT